MDIKEYQKITEECREYLMKTHQISGIYHPEDHYLQQYLTDTLIFQSEGTELDFLNDQIAQKSENLKEFLIEIKKELKPIIIENDVISAEEYLNYLKCEIGEHVYYLGFLLTKRRSLAGVNYSISKVPQIKNEPLASTSEQSIQKLDWKGNTLQFAELTKALIESGLVGAGLSDKDVFERMKCFFNVTDFDKSDKLAQVRKRTLELTPTITLLETSLTKWINHKL